MNIVHVVLFKIVHPEKGNHISEEVCSFHPHNRIKSFSGIELVEIIM